MSYRSKLPPGIKFDISESQSHYHTNEVCGSLFQGLATTIQQNIQNNKLEGLNNSINQVKKCIEARQYEVRKRSNPDPQHNHAIVVLLDLLKKLIKLREDVVKHGFDERQLEYIVIGFTKPGHGFNFSVIYYQPNGYKINYGGSKIKTRKTKIRKTKTIKRRMYKKTKNRKINFKTKK